MGQTQNRMELLRFAEAQATDALARGAGLAERNDIKALVGRIEPVTEDERRLARDVLDLLTLKDVDRPKASSTLQLTAALRQLDKGPETLIVSCTPAKWIDLMPQAVVICPSTVPIEEMLERKMTVRTLLIDAPGWEEDVLSGAGAVLAGIHVVAYRFGTESLAQGILLSAIAILLEGFQSPISCGDWYFTNNQRIPASSELIAKALEQVVKTSYIQQASLVQAVSLPLLDLSKLSSAELVRVQPPQDTVADAREIELKIRAVPVAPPEHIATVTPSAPSDAITFSEPAATVTLAERLAMITPSEAAAMVTPSEPAAMVTPSEPPATVTPSEPHGTVIPSNPPSTIVPEEPKGVVKSEDYANPVKTEATIEPKTALKTEEQKNATPKVPAINISIRNLFNEAREHRNAQRNHECYTICKRILFELQAHWTVADQDLLTEHLWYELAIVCYYVKDFKLGMRAVDRCLDFEAHRDFAFQCLWYYAEPWKQMRTVGTVVEHEANSKSAYLALDESAENGFVRLSFHQDQWAVAILDKEFRIQSTTRALAGPKDQLESIRDVHSIRLVRATSSQMCFEVIYGKNGRDVRTVNAELVQNKRWICRSRPNPRASTADVIDFPKTNTNSGVVSICNPASPLKFIVLPGTNYPAEYRGGPGRFANYVGQLIPFRMQYRDGFLGILRECHDGVAYHRFIFHDGTKMPRQRSHAFYFEARKEGERVLALTSTGPLLSLVITWSTKTRHVRIEAEHVRSLLQDLDVPSPWSAIGRPERVLFRQLGHMGRLGNQLLQIAGTRAVAKRYGGNVPDVQFEGSFNLSPAFKHSSEWYRSYQPSLWSPIVVDADKSHADIFNPPPQVVGGLSVELISYFQNASYWTDPVIRAAALRDFEPSDEMQARVHNRLRLPNPLSEYCAVHVRRGDYVSHYASAGGPLCLPWSYYEEAMKTCKLKRFLFFSEDIEYVKRHVRGRPDMNFVAPAGDLEDMFLMASCGALIISNSSYSWCAAFLSKHEGDRVIAPSPWFPHVKGSGSMVRSGWTVIRRGYPDATDMGAHASVATMMAKSVETFLEPPPAPVIPATGVENIFPIPYAIPTQHIAAQTKEKQHIIAELIPGMTQTYRFGAGQEKDYYEMYQTSRFGLTRRKGGWDCLRHYEMIAAGCIPFFEGIEQCPKLSLVSWPKDWLSGICRELMPWKEQYKPQYEIRVQQMLEYTRAHLSTDALATYLLSRLGKENGKKPKILLLRGEPSTNYTRELVTIALRGRLGNHFTEAPRIDALYQGWNGLATSYGFGYTYGGTLKDDPTIDRTQIEARIAAKEFDLIIYGRVGPDEGAQGRIPELPLWGTVAKHYSAKSIVFLFGGDGQYQLSNPRSHYTSFLLSHAKHGACFVRELSH